jgi:hypothetical protein
MTSFTPPSLLIIKEMMGATDPVEDEGDYKVLCNVLWEELRRLSQIERVEECGEVSLSLLS